MLRAMPPPVRIGRGEAGARGEPGGEAVVDAGSDDDVAPGHELSGARWWDARPARRQPLALSAAERPAMRPKTAARHEAGATGIIVVEEPAHQLPRGEEPERSAVARSRSPEPPGVMWRPPNVNVIPVVTAYPR